MDKLDLSVFFFSSDERYNYNFILDIAKFADENAFKAIWTPERHYHEFGGLYPSPAVLSSAIAAITQQISIRAGSVVLPLHNPFEVAEQWSIVDNISGGRIGVSVAPGFHPRDFVFSPEIFESRHSVLFEKLSVLQSIWSNQRTNEKIPGDATDSQLDLYPRPLQSELPVWLTAAASARTFENAGSLGLNVLTALMGQTLDELETKIHLYKCSRKNAGYDPESGAITLMLHTYLGDSEEEIEAIAKPALKSYLSTHTDFAVPLLKNTGIDVAKLTDADRAAILNRSFEKYKKNRSLVGTADYAKSFLQRLQDIGVTELACLVDFGLEYSDVIRSLERLKKLV